MVEAGIEFNADKVWKRKLTLNDGTKTFEFPQVGYGCYQVKTEESIFEAIRYGYRNIDTAQYYENEDMVNRQVKRAFTEFGLKRSDFFISTKVWCENMGYEKTKAIIKQCLENLADLEYIDLLFIHFPVNEQHPPDYPNHVQDRHDTWRAMEEAVDAGKVKFLGVSNFFPRHIEDILSIAKYRPVVNQFELHPLYVETDTIECCKKNGIIVQAYSPFAQWNSTLIEHPTLVRIA